MKWSYPHEGGGVSDVTYTTMEEAIACIQREIDSQSNYNSLNSITEHPIDIKDGKIFLCQKN